MQPGLRRLPRLKIATAQTGERAAAGAGSEIGWASVASATTGGGHGGMGWLGASARAPVRAPRGLDVGRAVGHRRNALMGARQGGIQQGRVVAVALVPISGVGCKAGGAVIHVAGGDLRAARSELTLELRDGAHVTVAACERGRHCAIAGATAVPGSEQIHGGWQPQGLEAHPARLAAVADEDVRRATRVNGVVVDGVTAVVGVHVACDHGGSSVRQPAFARDGATQHSMPIPPACSTESRGQRRCGTFAPWNWKSTPYW